MQGLDYLKGNKKMRCVEEKSNKLHNYKTAFRKSEILANDVLALLDEIISQR